MCPKDKLLLFEAKDGWEPLCVFLNLPVPDEKFPYPRLNDTAEFKKISNILNAAGYVLAAAAAAVVGMGVYSGASYARQSRWFSVR